MLNCFRFWASSPRALTGSVQPGGCAQDTYQYQERGASSAALTDDTPVCTCGHETDWTRLEELSPPSLVGALLPCTVCNRTFLPEALSRHQRICQRTANKKRKVFDSSRQRLQGTGIDPAEVRSSPSPPLPRRSASRSSWRDKHRQLLRTVRSARRGTGADTSVPPDYQQCPYCARHFGPKAADRHISWCKEQKSRIVPSTVPAVAKERLEARVKYQAPLPLRPRPKRLSVGRVSREASPAVNTDTVHTPAVRSPTRHTRDYAREYRERASQEREQRLRERRRSPAPLLTQRSTTDHFTREGSEPRTLSPGKESTVRRTQSFRVRASASRVTRRPHQQQQQQQQRTAHLSRQRRMSPAQQQQRYEPDGGEDVLQTDGGCHTIPYQRSNSGPTDTHALKDFPWSASDQRPGPGSGLDRDHWSVSPERRQSDLTLPGSAESQHQHQPARRTQSQPQPQEAYITRSELDAFHRLSQQVKLDGEYDPYQRAEKQLQALLAPGEPSPQTQTQTQTETETELVTRPQTKPDPGVPVSQSAEVSEPPQAVEPTSPVQSQSAFARIARPHSALTGTASYPLSEQVLKPTPLLARRDPIAEAICILNQYADLQRSAHQDSPGANTSVQQDPPGTHRSALRDPPGTNRSALQADTGDSPETDTTENSPGTNITNTSVPTNADSRGVSAPEERQQQPAESSNTGSPEEQQQQQQPWKPIQPSQHSSNRSSSDRDAGSAGGGELQFSESPPDVRSGAAPGHSSADSLYDEPEMPDFEEIMEEARRASLVRAAADSPRKARRRDLGLREMMGVEVGELNRRNGQPGPRFCHECGSQYPLPTAKYCCICGVQRLSV